MFKALAYLQYHSTKNRLVMRIKRLKQPKYLAGAIVGVLYFYGYFYRFLFGMNRGGAGVSVFADPQNVLVYELFGALTLFGILFLAWFFPRDRAALAFSEAEVAFLFPAPITRRGLVHFKVLRSQTAIFFSCVILTLLTRRGGGHVWIRALGWWMILSTLNLHLMGSSFTRTLLMDRGLTTWRRRLIIIVLGIVVVGGVVFWAKKTAPTLSTEQITDFQGFRRRVVQVLDTGPARVLLYPCRIVVRPYLSPTAKAFGTAVFPALVLLGLHYLWVIRMNVAFEEPSVEASSRIAAKVAAMRAGNWRGVKQKFKRKRPPFSLAPTGRPFVAIVWKNLISAGQGFSPRVWIVIAISVTAMCFGFVRGGVAAGGWQPIVAFIAGIILIWSVLLGPQLMRQDFRQDLAQIDFLKSCPMRGWEIAAGEILSPALVLAGVQWILLIVVIGLMPAQIAPALTLPVRVCLGACAAMVLPMMDLVILQIPNAAVLLFPAWFQSGKSGPQGFEATGQRIILLLGSVIAMTICLVPAAVAFLVAFIGCNLVAAPYVAAWAGSVAASVILAAEAAGGVMLLGWMFERFDSSAELGQS